MLKKQMQEYVNKSIGKEDTEVQSLQLFQEEYNYINKHSLISSEKINVDKIESASRFNDAYIERCDKETENLINEENISFLEQPLSYLKEHKNEFIYLESPWFEIIGVDAVSIEMDDVFGNYDVMLGLRLQKKLEKELKEQLHTLMQESDSSFDVMFSHDDGLWNVNFALNDISGFSENMSIKEAYILVYSSIFKLAEEIEEK
jgi:hypothetical protein